MKKQEVIITLDSLIRSIESAINWSQQIDEAQAARDRGIGARYNSLSDVADLGIDDYVKFIEELKFSLAQYGLENNNKDIMTKVETIMTEPKSTNTILNTILLYLKSEKN